MCMHSAWRLSAVKTGITKLSSKELGCECFRSGEVLARQVRRTWLLTSICHVRCHEKRVSNFEGMLWVLNLVYISRERLWVLFSLLKHGLLLFDTSINLCIKFSLFPKFIQEQVSVSQLRIL